MAGRAVTAPAGLSMPLAAGLVITVRGTPAPQGSKRAFAVRGKGGIPTGRVAVIESSHDRVKSWRQAVLDAALAAMGELEAQRTEPGFPLDGPLVAAVTFTLPRPKGHYGTGRNALTLKPSAPITPGGKPDLSKLLRSTEDALTDAGVWRDDAQIVDYQRLAKCYPGDGRGTAGLRLPNASVLSGVAGADALPVPGAVIRVHWLEGGLL